MFTSIGLRTLAATRSDSYAQIYFYVCVNRELIQIIANQMELMKFLRGDQWVSVSPETVQGRPDSLYKSTHTPPVYADFNDIGLVLFH